MPKPPFAPLDFAPAEIETEMQADGSQVLRSPQALDDYPPKLGLLLERWAAEAPDRTFLAERDGDGWREVSYGAALQSVRALGQALLDRGLGPERPLMILSDNGVDNGLLQLAAMHVGIPVAPVSPAYSLMSRDHAKLKYIFELVTPGLVFAADGERFATAISAIGLEDCDLVVSANPPAGMPATQLAELLATVPGGAVDAAYAAVGPDTVTKILFTSGSTGMPKGVINTQRMLCSNQQAIAQVWPFLAAQPPVVVDWLPWNHTFGGNHNFNMVLRHGGTLYVDGGKPMPGLIEQTVANLESVAPTLYFNVPRGFDVLLPFLEQDEVLRDRFFSRLDLIFYAGAALPQSLWERLEVLSIAARGERVPMVSAWGSTETAPMITTVHFPLEHAGVIGLPAPGCAVKMVPNGQKQELRIKGPNITPGYWRRPDLTEKAFDDDGWYCIGDAGRLEDPERPERGIVFDGRVAEDFKLLSGTWVHAGVLRVTAIAAGAPVIQDAVVTGHDRQEVGLLVFPNLPGCKALCPEAGDDVEALLRCDAVRERLLAGFNAYNAQHGASSRRISRLLLMAEPPLIDANEITDKGYINQGAVLERRAGLVERLYAADTDDPEVLVFD
jgi:feruloyl-CoA synthase